MKLSFDVDRTEEQRYCAPSSENEYLIYRECPFEMACFQNTTIEILEWNVRNFPQLFSSFIKEKELAHGDFLFLRLPALDINNIKQAEAAGFYFIECSIIPYIRLRTWDREKFTRLIQPMERATPATIPAVEEISRSAFQGGRFSLDPNLDNDRADFRYLSWLRNAYENGEDIQIIRHHGEVAGFSLLRFEQEKVVYRLAFIRTDLQNTGIGMMLFASTMAYCMDLGVKQIDGGISMANLPVLNTMTSLGFIFRDPTIVLHYYVH